MTCLLSNASSNMMQVFFLPPNATSVCQPLDQGIIENWKSYYRRQWLQFVVEEAEADREASRTVTILHALRWGIAAWHIDVAITTIKNCWLKARVLPVSMPLSSREHEEIRQIEMEQERDMLHDVSGSLQTLLDHEFVEDVVPVREFLNPVGEVVDDSDEDLIDLI